MAKKLYNKKTKKYWDGGETDTMPIQDLGGDDIQAMVPRQTNLMESDNPQEINYKAPESSFDLKSYSKYSPGYVNTSQTQNSGDAVYKAGMSAVSKAGPIGAIIGTAASIGDAIGDPIRKKAEEINPETGGYKDISKAKTMGDVGSFLNPFKGLTTVLFDKDASFKSKLIIGLTGGAGTGLSGYYKDKDKAMRDRAKPELEAKRAEEERLRKEQHDKMMSDYFSRNSQTTFNTYEYGGQMDQNGQLTQIDGPRHEQGGVYVGNGNEVEGGESINKDFVFSDTLKVPGTKKTFADWSKKIENKYKLRPYDSLSLNAKQSELDKLKASQEQFKAEKDINALAKFNKANPGLLDKLTSQQQSGNEQMRSGGNLKYIHKTSIHQTPFHSDNYVHNYMKLLTDTVHRKYDSGGTMLNSEWQWQRDADGNIIGRSINDFEDNSVSNQNQSQYYIPDSGMRSNIDGYNTPDIDVGKYMNGVFSSDVNKIKQREKSNIDYAYPQYVPNFTNSYYQQQDNIKGIDKSKKSDDGNIGDMSTSSAIGMGVQGAGLIAEGALLAARNKYMPAKYEVQDKINMPINYDRLSANEPLRQAELASSGYKDAIVKGSQSQGQMLSNLGQYQTKDAMTKAAIVEDVQNKNAQIQQSETMARYQEAVQNANIEMQNIERKLRVGEINQKEYDAQTQNWLQYINNIQQTTAGMSKDFSGYSTQKNIIKHGLLNGQIVGMNSNGDIIYTSNGQKVPGIVSNSVKWEENKRNGGLLKTKKQKEFNPLDDDLL